MSQWYEKLFQNYAKTYDNESFTHGTLGKCDFLKKEFNYDINNYLSVPKFLIIPYHLSVFDSSSLILINSSRIFSSIFFSFFEGSLNNELVFPAVLI